MWKVSASGFRVINEINNTNMNIYTMPCTCSVCGGEGEMIAKDIHRLYLGAQARHRDPEVCAQNLERRRKKLDEREAKLNNNIIPKPNGRQRTKI